MTAQQYNKWMHDPNNSMNCSECPENIGASDWQDRHPCGQWNCWVDLHVRPHEHDERWEINGY
jgi:hypothetical protein